MCAFLLGRDLQSPAPVVWHLDGGEETSVPLRCVDPACIRTVQCSRPVPVHS